MHDLDKIDYLSWFHGVRGMCDGIYINDNYYHFIGSFPESETPRVGGRAKTRYL